MSEAFDIFTLRRLFPGYRLQPASTTVVLRNWNYHRISKADVQLISSFLAIPINAPLYHLSYVPVTPALAHISAYSDCTMCGRPYTDAVHYPVMLRCGCIFGECCVVLMLAKKAEFNISLNPVMQYPEEMFCPTAGCGKHVVPMLEWRAWRQQRVSAAGYIEAPGNEEEEEVIAAFEDHHCGQFLHCIYDNWVARLTSVPDPLHDGSLWINVLQDRNAVYKAHRGIISEKYWNMRWHLGGIRAPDVPGFIDDGVVVEELLDWLSQYNAKLRRLTLRLVDDFVVGTLSNMERWAHRSNEQLPQSMTPDGYLYEWYVEQLVHHSLVQMRINQETCF